MSKQVIVVPCYNEARRLEFERFIEFAPAGVSVLFVDDGSKDETRAIIASFISARPTFDLLPLDRNGGKAEAVRQGLLRAIDQGADLVGYLDADLATPPREMLKLVAAVRSGAQMALGSRVSLLGRRIERHAARHYLGRIFATAASLSLGMKVYDTQCGAKAFAVSPTLKNALSMPFKSRWVFDVELIDRLIAPADVIAPMPVTSVIEVPLEEWRDVKGSKLGVMAMARAGSDLMQIALRRRLRRSPQR